MEQQEGHKDWNMAIAFLQQLDKRRDESSIAYSEGELLKTYRIYLMIFRDIHFKIKEKKTSTEDIDTLFKSIKDKLYKNNPLHNEQVEAEEELNKLGILLNDLLYDFDLTFGKKSDNNPSKAIKVGMFGKK